MYRLITPVVDFANKSIGHDVYFEFNQTSSHGASQSVDIAMLKAGKPVLMIEAKRINRKISAELITKYLEPGLRGIVTNGESWILCSDGKNNCISLTDGEPIVVAKKLDKIVSFIINGANQSDNWNEEPKYYRSEIQPIQLSKINKATRKSNAITQVKNFDQIIEFIKSAPKLSKLDIELLHSVFENLEQNGGFNDENDFEIRSTRLSIFQIMESTGKRVRIGRVEFGKRNPDVLVLTKLVEENSDFDFMTSAPHDKGKHMRRFRPFDKEQVQLLGEALTKILFQN
ncbi:hypothetical protein QWY87_09435 [Lutimonas halocynthiae]|uniref:hypothetical protein n=1 Tax=Lutimonas halocynthiae TaxID=1446477 RepID=UPI0025B3FE04|nr:hypothetical protein [Lutimonas halocynthiae]MDN3642921.1 hypothetical protein [Lutimonas halocynthiae]